MEWEDDGREVVVSEGRRRRRRRKKVGKAESGRNAVIGERTGSHNEKRLKKRETTSK